MKKILFLFWVLFFQILLFSDSHASALGTFMWTLSSQYIVDGISGTKVDSDTVQLNIQWMVSSDGYVYKESNITLFLSSTTSCGDNVWRAVYTDNSPQIFKEEQGVSSISGKYLCIDIIGTKDNGGSTTDRNDDYLVSSTPFNLSAVKTQDTTPPNILSFTSNLSSWIYWSWQTIVITLTSDDTLSTWSTLTVGLSNNRSLTLNYNSTNTLQWTFTVGSNPWVDDSITTLNVSSIISWYLQNTDYTISNSLTIPLVNLSTNGNITLDTVAPSLIFSDGVNLGSVDSDTISIGAYDNNIGSTLDLNYTFSTSQNCSNLTSYTNTFMSWQSFSLTGTSNNGKYLCLKAVDKAKNITYLASSNKIDITISSSSSTDSWIDDNVVMLWSTWSMTPLAGSSSWTVYNWVVDSPVVSQSIPSTSSTWSIPDSSYQNAITGWVDMTSYNQVTYVPSWNDDTSSTSVLPTSTLPTTSLTSSAWAIDPSEIVTAPYTTWFTDIQGSFAKTYIEELANMWVIATESSEFHPDEPITRAEFLKMILKSQNLDYSELPSKTDVFKDLISGDWKMKVALKGYELGITSWYEDNTFRPDVTITRIEAIKFLLKVISPNLEDTNSTSFIDINDSWMKKYVNEAKNLWLINGQSTPFWLLFKPNTEMTRWEAAKIIAKALEQKK